MSGPSLPTEMLAAQVIEFNKPYKLHLIPVPTRLSPHDLLIKVAVASLCHTDTMVSRGVMNGTPLPCTASHEGAGTVVLTGSAIQAFSPGDRIMAGLVYGRCGSCASCTAGPGPLGERYSQYCASLVAHLGVSGQGFFADYAIVDARTAVPLPDSVAFETAAPLACAGCTVYRGVKVAGVGEGEWLGIVGSGGGLGHLGVQFAKAVGCKVVGIDARDEGLELSREGGADVVVDARVGWESVVEEVRKVTGGTGVKTTLNLSDADEAAAVACAITKMHGTVVQIAQPENVSIPFAELVFRDIRVRGSLICSPEEAREMLQVVAGHGVSVKTNPFNGLGEIEKLVDLAHSGKMKGKGVIIVDREQVEKEKSGLKMI